MTPNCTAIATDSQNTPHLIVNLSVPLLVTQPGSDTVLNLGDATNSYHLTNASGIWSEELAGSFGPANMPPPEKWKGLLDRLRGAFGA